MPPISTSGVHAGELELAPTPVELKLEMWTPTGSWVHYDETSPPQSKSAGVELDFWTLSVIWENAESMLSRIALISNDKPQNQTEVLRALGMRSSLTTVHSIRMNAAGTKELARTPHRCPPAASLSLQLGGGGACRSTQQGCAVGTTHDAGGAGGAGGSGGSGDAGVAGAAVLRCGAMLGTMECLGGAAGVVVVVMPRRFGAEGVSQRDLQRHRVLSHAGCISEQARTQPCAMVGHVP
ncbi:hypothetical protein ST47_g8167 [Ascochyta rabiei]|uniref:Uncharacterized protein n=1 Tax=Didymella rabiei TaxID=5454 RepID=A0A162ZLR5_DIDRA|nr:hypothetical protein ST47_g8167 [Ascochyta rabiei]